MNIIADENIPFAKEAFQSLGKVSTLPGREMRQSDLIDCDCLLVRSVTRVNQQLLENTAIKFVASATIGTDHIDLDYLQQQGIGFANAPGCNAESASEYVINVLFYLAQQKGFDPFQLTAGIVGYGNVGSRVKNKLDALGIHCLINDPPKQDAGDDSVNYVSLQTILHECDFITLHVPLTHDGEHPTRHLFSDQQLSELTPGCILFNAARGSVIDNQALSSLLEQRKDLTVFLDTWEGEPSIDMKLLSQVDFGSPHIAGYSYEGKLRGTQMILDACCAYFDTSSHWNMQDHLPQKQTIELQSAVATEAEIINAILQQHYPVQQDYQRLQALAELESCEQAKAFDQLRKNYPVRYEYSQYQIEGLTADKKTASLVERLLFTLRE
jgi:erythronate-4-phosphate dehydrogenase